MSATRLVFERQVLHLVLLLALLAGLYAGSRLEGFSDTGKPDMDRIYGSADVEATAPDPE